MTSGADQRQKMGRPRGETCQHCQHVVDAPAVHVDVSKHHPSHATVPPSFGYRECVYLRHTIS